MSHIRLSAIACLLALSMMTAFGCAKKQVTAEPGQQETSTTAGSTSGGEGYSTAKDSEGVSGRDLEEEERRKAAAMAQAQENIDAMIFFAFDSFALSPESRAILQAKAEALGLKSGVTLVIEGHCDERGTDEYNLALGERRARAAYEYLVRLGVSPSRLSLVSFGEERPLMEGDSESAWAKNRRCEFK